MIKAHKIRLHPTPEQANYFAKAAGTARYAFNWAIAQWKQQYEAGKKPSALALRTQFHALRKEDITLADRVFVCPDPNCGYVGDRDENAAYNIIGEALRMFGLNLNLPSGVVATTRRKTAWGPGVRPKE